MTQQEKYQKVLSHYERMLEEIFKCKARIYEAGEDINVTFKVKFIKKDFTEEYIYLKKELNTICETRHVLFEKNNINDIPGRKR